MEESQAIKRIEEKLQALLRNHQQLQKEAQRLQKETERLNTLLNEQAERTKVLKQKADAFSITGSAGVSSKKELEKRINTYLKDIERCLALLHT